MAQRVIKGGFFEEEGYVFALLEPVFDLNPQAIAQLCEAGKQASSSRLGKITVSAIPDRQYIGVITDRAGVKRRHFAAMVQGLFPDCKLQVDKWITRSSKKHSSRFDKAVMTWKAMSEW